MKALGRFLVSERIPGFAVPLYDRIAASAREGYYSQVAEEIVSALPEGRVLDIGTGPGYLPLELLRRNPSLSIDAIDLSPAMVRLARRNALREGLDELVRFQVGNAYRLPFPEDAFDMVVSTGVFHSWKHPERALNEAYRVLKLGGSCLIYDPARLASGVRVERLCRGWRDRLALGWVGLTWRLWPREYTVASIREILGQSRFEDFHVEQGVGFKITLRKANRSH